jgi:23S rRNA pseudouridine1911/1915/1917 synthase
MSTQPLVLWQDDDMAILNKPAGISVNPSETEKEITLVEMVLNELHITLERAGIVHRLDKDTSGVILVAKNENALEKLQAQFKSRTVEKSYITLVHGFIDEKAGEIQAPIARNPANREKFTIVEGGRDSTTKFQVVRHIKMSLEKIEQIVDDMRKKEQVFYEREAMEYTLLNVFPKTGRTHQIRVHMKYIHHPLVGDEVYTGKKLYRLDKRWCPRQFLHAFSIRFDHPVNGERMYFEVPLNEDLDTALKFLEK